MKPVYCTIGGSLNNVCHISTVVTSYQANWKGNTRQDKCESIDDIKKFISETGMELVMFAVRSNGIPNRAVKVSDTEKLEKVFKKFEKVINKWGGV
jgi:hypothetical protein